MVLALIISIVFNCALSCIIGKLYMLNRADVQRVMELAHKVDTEARQQLRDAEERYHAVLKDVVTPKPVAPGPSVDIDAWLAKQDEKSKKKSEDDIPSAFKTIDGRVLNLVQGP